MNFTPEMDSIVYSQQHLDPLPRHYQGNDPKEFAYQCFVDWKDEHPSGDLSEYLVVIQAVNHAAHWVRADITEHIKLQATLRALNAAIFAKRKLPEYTRKFFAEYTQYLYPRPTRRLTLVNHENYFREIAAITSSQHNAHILNLRTSLAATKVKIRAIKEERFRTPLLEMIYDTILGDHKFTARGVPDQQQHLQAPHPRLGAREPLLRHLSRHPRNKNDLHGRHVSIISSFGASGCASR